MIKTELIAKSELPTKYGDFTIYVFKENNKEHAALVKGDAKNRGVNARIHSKCLTGDVLGSLRCDCGEQLIASMDYIGKNGGVLVYLDQEGRGIGLLNKIRAYALQDFGFDTFQSNEMLGFANDERDYSVVIEIFAVLGVSSIKLFTNNPDKVEFLRKNGIKVSRVPLKTAPNKHNAFYLKTKKLKAGHLL